MMIALKEGERIDDLQRGGFQIIQNPAKFCFGMDAVLLSGFSWIRKNEKVLDLGTGNGILPILLAAKTEGRQFTGLEIQPELADMASRSVILNDLTDRIRIMEGDLRQADQLLGRASFDVVVSNPPYMNQNHGLTNPQEAKAIARHEITCSLEDVVCQASRVLKPGGRFFMVHRPHRLAEIMHWLDHYRMEPKRMRMVHPYEDADANMVLIESVRGAGSWLKMEPPLIVYESAGVYTKEILRIYGKE